MSGRESAPPEVVEAGPPYRCDWKFCGQPFEAAAELADHQREHSDEINDYRYDERDDK